MFMIARSVGPARGSSDASQLRVSASFGLLASATVQPWVRKRMGKWIDQRCFTKILTYAAERFALLLSM